MKEILTETETETPKKAAIDWNNLDEVVNEKPVTDANALDSDLSEYKNSSINFNTSDFDKSTSDKDDQTTVDESYDEKTDKSLYYQSGKKKGQRKPQGTRVSYNPTKPAQLSGEFLTGSIVIMLIDILLPLIFAGINNTVSKKKIDADKLKLTDKQKKEFEPIADAVLKSIKIEANPVLVLAIGLIGAYGMNFYLIKNDIESE